MDAARSSFSHSRQAPLRAHQVGPRPQAGRVQQTARMPAISGIARNRPGMPQTSSQNRHASITVVAFRSMLRPMTSGTIEVALDRDHDRVEDEDDRPPCNGDDVNEASRTGGMPATIGPMYGT